MRPPHYAGENSKWQDNETAQPRASMRPPHYAGENKEALQTVWLLQLASMRPPHYAGENIVKAAKANAKLLASMRPPHYAGENSGAGPPARSWRRGFNEAPALRGGKPPSRMPISRRGSPQLQ